MKQTYTIGVDKLVIDDLKRRLAVTRWTDEIDNDKWQYGTSEKYLRELCDYWQNQFDWNAQQTYLNSFNHFKTEIDGNGIHFIQQKGRGRNPVPLLLIHGFPDSFVRFLKIIPKLTEADENGVSFDLVIPSIPGYGFSDIPKKPGMDTKEIGNLFNKLMTEELGYKKYLVQGGDWGTSIAEKMALYHDRSLIGMHLTDVPFGHLFSVPEGHMTGAEKKYMDDGKKWQQTEGGYASIQSTKPQALGYALNDSPAGLAGWIIQMFYSWSENDGKLENSFTKDELLTNLTIYWATQTINSAIRIYFETMKSLMNDIYNPLVKLNPFDKSGKKTQVPAAFAVFPRDLVNAPRKFAEKYFNVNQWTEMPRGGHFAAMEEPDLLVEDVRKFASKLTPV